MPISDPKLETRPAPTELNKNGTFPRGLPLQNGAAGVPAAEIPPPAFQENGRFRRILLFFAGVILHLVLFDILGTRIPILGPQLRQTRPHRFRRLARRFRELAVAMGGVMIKLGQFLSARVDVLPPEITEELQGLQDEVPPEDPARLLAVLTAELGNPADHFAYIEREPQAAASLGQAHRAWLRPANGQSELGEAVVIKIQRPHIERIVTTDLAALRIVARWTMRYKPIRRRADVPALLEEFSQTLWEELDYEAEADNAERFAKLYADSMQVYIPAVYRQYSTARVIVLENVEAIKITDMAQMQAEGIDTREVAETLLDTYFYQIFREGFFHADPHPGNLFVRPRTDLPWPPEGERGPSPTGRPFWLIFVDFGMVGRVPELMGDNLRQMLISVTQRDGRRLTEAYQNLGFFLPGADLDRIAEAQDAVLDRIWGRDLLDLARPDPEEVQELGEEFRDLLFDFPFQVPQDFIYLGRAIGMVSGLVSQLDEQINPWYFIEKYGEEAIRTQRTQEFGLEMVWETVRPYLNTPAQVQRLLNLAESGKLRVQSDREVLRRYDKIEKRLSQLGWSILGAAGMLSATLLYLNRKKDNEASSKK